MPGTIAGMQVESHESAAARHGLPVPHGHARHLTVGRSRGWPVGGAVTHRNNLRDDEIETSCGVLVTAPLRTVADCARTMPFGWGLAVADAALRLRLIGDRELAQAARSSRGPGAPQLRRVARWADARADSPLESLTRALLVDAEIGPLALQYRLEDDGHPYDLHVVGTRVLVECDGAQHHRGPDRFVQDCEDATTAAAARHLVIRLTWYDVTRRPRWSIDHVRAAVARPARVRRCVRDSPTCRRAASRSPR